MNRKGLIWTEEELSTAKTNSLLTKICDKLEINIRDCKKLEFD